MLNISYWLKIIRNRTNNCSGCLERTCYVMEVLGLYVSEGDAAHIEGIGEEKWIFYCENIFLCRRIVISSEGLEGRFG